MKEEYIEKLEKAFCEECYEVISTSIKKITDQEFENECKFGCGIRLEYKIELKVYNTDECVISAKGNDLQNLQITYNDSTFFNPTISETMKSKIRRIVVEYNPTQE